MEINTRFLNSGILNGAPTASGYTAPSGLSGLRFSDLSSASIPQLNPSESVLSVNANGDVIFVPGVLQLGTPCITTPANFLATSLTSNRVIPNRNFNLWFGSLNSETGGIGVGGQADINSFCALGNTFEISANSNNVQYGNTDASGLRFKKLTSASPVIANTVNGVDNTKVLTVDGDGDVVLVTASAGSRPWMKTGLTLTDIDLRCEMFIRLSNTQ